MKASRDFYGMRAGYIGSGAATVDGVEAWCGLHANHSSEEARTVRFASRL